jgi:hypothetical protein
MDIFHRWNFIISITSTMFKILFFLISVESFFSIKIIYFSIVLYIYITTKYVRVKLNINKKNK